MSYAMPVCVSAIPPVVRQLRERAVAVHINGSAIYIYKAGHWQAIYRAQVR